MAWRRIPNELRHGTHRLFVSDRFEVTNRMLDREGYRLVTLPTEQIGRIDAGLACMSLRWASGRSRS